VFFESFVIIKQTLPPECRIDPSVAPLGAIGSWTAVPGPPVPGPGFLDRSSWAAVPGPAVPAPGSSSASSSWATRAPRLAAPAGARARRPSRAQMAREVPAIPQSGCAKLEARRAALRCQAGSADVISDVIAGPGTVAQELPAQEPRPRNCSSWTAVPGPAVPAPTKLSVQELHTIVL
jgi:hypothetical protein